MFHRFRSMPATAMAAVLGCALMATAATPAVAREKQKKEDTAQGPKLSPSKGFMPIAQKMDETLKKKDAAGLQAAVTEGQSAATSNDDKYFLGFYTLQLGVLTKDQALQAQGLDTALESGVVPATDAAVYNFFSGQFAYQAKDYAKAAQRLEAAHAAGSTEAALPDVLLDSYVKSGQVDKGVAFAKDTITKALAAGQRPSEQMFVIPARALQEANRNDEMFDMLALRVQAYPNPQTWNQTLRLLLGTTSGNKAMSLDVFRLMRATGSLLNRNEVAEYAALATEGALPGEAVSVIRDSKQSGIVKASDSQLNDMLKTQTERAGDEESTLDAYAKKPSTLSNPKVAGATGDALIGYGHYAQAIPLYQAAASAGGADKETWTYRLAVAQALSGDTAAAKAGFGQITGAYKLLSRFWVAKLDAVPAAPAAAAPAAPAQPTTGG
ncbi:tetratricopeptide repeat protein [Sphingopyxis panaciterrulae]|uniref:Tetratricopeptide repeat protein n=1 Tax=Sphingopyxis panaciterrulae TaxID=462372 RepID=A0A7W9ET93_9SPHN|nr:tetratricopeptide repeat protein [Sphingopyxis panaciterrulae]MBB5707970.1 hypothetical protein [Sphingopyxis panaciterrulae]